MEFSTVFRASNGTVPSLDGSLIASVVPPRLIIRSSSTLQIQRVIPLKPNFAAGINHMKWSPLPQSNLTPGTLGLIGKRRSGIDNSEEEGTSRQRLLLADDNTVQVYDMSDEKWCATIQQGFEGIKNVEFGRNCEEVIVFSDFLLKVTVWNLNHPPRRIDIPNPKFATKGYDYRPCTSHFALLTRSGTHDVVSIHQNTSYRVSSSFTLPTIDAQGLKWSPCGRWLAVWDSATAGYKVLIYTADGHLYRTHQKDVEGLGVKTVEWSPGGDFLTIGGYDGKLCFLNNYTFSPVISMNHTRTVRLSGVTVWQEELSSRNHTYTQKQQPTTLPTLAFNPQDTLPRTGVSEMAYSNPDGTLISTRNENMPNTVWIWSLKLLRPYAVLVHHYPVKAINWHPSIPELLLIQCNSEPNGQQPSARCNSVYLWSSSWNQPRAVQVPMESITGSLWAKWIHTTAPSRCNSSSTISTSPLPFASGGDLRSHSPEKEQMERRAMLLIGDKEGFVVGYVEEEPVPEELEAETIKDGGGALRDRQEHQPWRPVDWTAYSPSNGSTTKQHSANKTTPHHSEGEHNRRNLKLGRVDEKSATTSASSQPPDDTFESKVWKGMLVR